MSGIVDASDVVLMKRCASPCNQCGETDGTHDIYLSLMSATGKVILVEQGLCEGCAEATAASLRAALPLPPPAPAPIIFDDDEIPF